MNLMERLADGSGVSSTAAVTMRHMWHRMEGKGTQDMTYLHGINRACMRFLEAVQSTGQHFLAGMHAGDTAGGMNPIAWLTRTLRREVMTAMRRNREGRR